MVAVAASLDHSDFAVDAFESAVGESEFDRRDDAVEVAADGAGEIDEGGDAAAGGGGEPAAQLGPGVLGFDAAVEHARLGREDHRAAQGVDHLRLLAFSLDRFEDLISLGFKKILDFHVRFR